MPAPFVADPPADEPAAAKPEPDVEPAAPDPAPPPRHEPRRGGGLFGTLLGGALAAAGGFALSHFDLLQLAPGGASTEVTELAARLQSLETAQAEAIATLQADAQALDGRLAKLESAPAPAAPDLSRLDDVEQRLSALAAIPSEGGASTMALTARLAELEQRLAALPAAGTDPALQQQLDQALAQLAEAEAAAKARADEAAAAAKAAARALALDALTEAVMSGGAFGPALQAMADPTLDAALGPLAESGVPTLATLQADFPPAARAALQLARESSTETGWGSRLVDFLAAQTGARPLTPQEGTTPDAVLSRAEFALSEGRVADSLAELAPLEAAIKAPLDPWIAAANAHLAAMTALQTARGE